MSGLASEVNVTRAEQTVRTIPTNANTIVAAVGVTERGPIGESPLTTSFQDWQRIFGRHTLNNLDMVEAVKGIYAANRNAQVRTSRVVHTTIQGDPTTKTSAAGSLMLQTAATAPTAGYVLSTNAQPYDLEPGDTLVISEDGGAPVTVTVAAAAASRQNGVDATFNISNGQNITVRIDGGAVQTIAFLTAEFVAINAATAAEVAAVINAKLVGGYATVTGAGLRVTIWSDTRGLSSGVEVTGGTANGALQFNTAAVIGSGDVANIDSVTAAELEALIDVAGFNCSSLGGYVRITSGTTGALSTMQVQAASTADTVLGFDNAVHSGTTGAAVNTLNVVARYDGAYAGNVTVRIGAATSGSATEFKLTVLSGGVAAEPAFDNLTMDDTLPNYVETVINHAENGSQYITVADQDASPVDMPNLGTFGPLTGGSDGLVGLTDTDFIGGSTTNGQTGLSCLDRHAKDILLVPGRATSAVQNAMVSYGELHKCYPVLDSPAGYSASQIETYMTTTASLFQLSEHGAMYWPRIKVVNPDKTLYGNADTVVVAPCGDIAGVMLIRDQYKVGGVFDSPAGIEFGRMSRVMGLENDSVTDKGVRERLYPKNINPISKEEGSPYFIDGSRNLKTTGAWPSVGQNRGIIFIEKRCETGLAFARHRNITDKILASCSNTIKVFMIELTKAGSLASIDPQDAFDVDFGAGLNTPITKRQKAVYGRLAVATATPGEFVNLSISNDTRALDEAIAALTA